MESNGRFAILHNPVFRVVATWVWFFAGGTLTALVIVVVNGVGFTEAAQVLGERQQLAVYIEIVAVGLLPVIFAWAAKEKLRDYGLSREGLGKSLVLSLLFVAVMFVIGYLKNGQIMIDDRPDLALAFPWNLYYGLLGILAWGPLEVFFFMWLVSNTERIVEGGHKLASWGLVITVAIFAVTHIITTGTTNAVYTGAIFLVLGLIYKYTDNIYGPMLAWTLINGQVWYLARLLRF